MVDRELRIGPAIAGRARASVWPRSGSPTSALAAGLRVGALDADWEQVAPALAATARDQLLVANPSYLPADSA